MKIQKPQENLKNLKITVDAHTLLRIYCAQRGLAITKAASEIIEDWIRQKENEEEIEKQLK